MSKFILVISKDMVKECRATMLVKEMDISSLIIHAQHIEEEKIKAKERKNKKVRICSFNLS